MRVRHLVGAAAGAVLLTAAAPATAGTAPARGPLPVPATTQDTLTIDRTGRITSDGTAELSGTYSCTVSGSKNVAYIVTRLRQGTDRRGISGTRATCDGEQHTWRTENRPVSGSWVVGPARVEASLMLADTSSDRPPRTLATAQRDILLIA